MIFCAACTLVNHHWTHEKTTTIWENIRMEHFPHPHLERKSHISQMTTPQLLGSIQLQKNSTCDVPTHEFSWLRFASNQNMALAFAAANPVVGLHPGSQAWRARKAETPQVGMKGWNGREAERNHYSWTIKKALQIMVDIYIPNILWLETARFLNYRQYHTRLAWSYICIYIYIYMV